ncbi:hypothetical protein GMLC_15960 [Geomonas limicola]|uniref:Glycosyltransferase 61 catalytic domain-containing protein n=1 Tax=Geomonas limicola TaxID=2740186 RepID=A0A6V8N8C4_9BACT|nr:glycosyltransferase family 61 protein [Geomonas limicola]GFO68017.1 hypothetical protein GMLC_15960 [Geomonas limicola]
MKHGLTEAEARERRRLARQVSSALLGPIAGKMPYSSIESLEKLSYRPELAKHILDILPMLPAELVRHLVPAGYPPFIRSEAVFERRNLYLLKDVVVSPQSGMVWLENKIAEESVGSLRRIMDWGELLHEPLLPVTELPLEDPVLVCHPASYFHWLMEVLPGVLLALASFPGLKILTPEQCPNYLTQGLIATLGPQIEERVITCPGPVRVEQLVLPQYPLKSEFVHPKVLEMLRSEVRDKLTGAGTPQAGGKTGEVFYISRRKGKKRRLAGEDRLEERLNARGVTVLHCEEMTLPEQVRTFQRARMVIGTHGAGLSNLVWCESPCRVVEIFPHNYILDCFAWLSFSLGFDYHHVICQNGHELDEAAVAATLKLLERP